jgi:hypothetical protein
MYEREMVSAMLHEERRGEEACPLTIVYEKFGSDAHDAGSKAERRRSSQESLQHDLVDAVVYRTINGE